MVCTTAPVPGHRRRRAGSGSRHPLQRRNRQVVAHHHLVPPLANHYARCSGECRDDLQQAGLLGLIRAAELYDASHGTPFAAFARPHIRGAILHHLRDRAPLVRLPRRLAELRERLRQAPLSAEASAVAMDRQGQSLQWLLERQHRLNHPIPLDSVEPGGFDAELLGWEQDPEPMAEALPLADLLAGLALQEREVVTRVVLTGGSYRQVGRELGISAMTVQRRLRRGLAALRQALEARGYSR